jgi:hypothetical protein
MLLSPALVRSATASTLAAPVSLSSVCTMRYVYYCIVYDTSLYTLGSLWSSGVHMELGALLAIGKAIYPSSHLSASCPCTPSNYRSGGIC